MKKKQKFPDYFSGIIINENGSLIKNVFNEFEPNVSSIFLQSSGAISGKTFVALNFLDLLISLSEISGDVGGDSFINTVLETIAGRYFNEIQLKPQELVSIVGNNLKLCYIDKNGNVSFKGSPEYTFLDYNSIVISEIGLEFLSKYGNRKLSNTILEFCKYPQYTIFDNYGMDSLKNNAFSLNLAPFLYSNLFQFKYKWLNLVDTINAKYDILKPFDITLTENVKDNMTVSVDDSDSSSEGSTYAFNSSTEVPTGKVVNSSQHEYSRQNPIERNYSRKGNIGNKSNAQLIEEERKKAIFNLKQIFFEDIASVLCRKTYT